MAPLSQSYSFSSQGGNLSSSQYAQNSTSDIAEGLRRVTVGQLLKATETGNIHAPFKIDGSAIRQVILVANIYLEDANSSSSKITYGLDDGTGRIMGNQWTANRRPGESGESLFKHFAYARVSGELSAYKTTRNLKISQIVPICNAYEVYYHVLHAIFDTIALERGPPPQQLLLQQPTVVNEIEILSESLLQNVSISGQGASSNFSTKTSIAGSGRQAEANSSGLTSASSLSQPYINRSELTPLEQDIIHCINDNEIDEEEKGVHVSDFVPAVKTLNPTLTSHELWSALENLTRRGLLHAPFSDEYYCCI